MVRFAVDARVARVWLARADKKNAFDAEMIAEITRVFRELAQRNDVHVVTLAGEGTTFSAGADLAYMKEMAQYSLEQNQDDARKLDEMFWAIRSLPQPLVGRIHGHAMGGALGITALCDFAYVEEKTKFCFSEVKLGIAPAVISPYVLEKMASAQAMRYMLSGEVFSANEALGAGLVTDVGDLAHVDAWVESCVAGLVKNGPEAMRATKTLLRRQSRLGVSAES